MSAVQQKLYLDVLHCDHSEKIVNIFRIIFRTIRCLSAEVSKIAYNSLINSQQKMRLVALHPWLLRGEWTAIWSRWNVFVVRYRTWTIRRKWIAGASIGEADCSWSTIEVSKAPYNTIMWVVHSDTSLRRVIPFSSSLNLSSSWISSRTISIGEVSPRSDCIPHDPPSQNLILFVSTEEFASRIVTRTSSGSIHPPGKTVRSCILIVHCIISLF